MFYISVDSFKRHNSTLNLALADLCSSPYWLIHQFSQCSVFTSPVVFPLSFFSFFFCSASSSSLYLGSVVVTVSHVKKPCPGPLLKILSDDLGHQCLLLVLLLSFLQEALLLYFFHIKWEPDWYVCRHIDIMIFAIICVCIFHSNSRLLFTKKEKKEYRAAMAVEATCIAILKRWRGYHRLIDMM